MFILKIREKKHAIHRYCQRATHRFFTVSNTDAKQENETILSLFTPPSEKKNQKLQNVLFAA